MGYFVMKHNGQATIEFLLTLVIALMFIVTIIQPNANFASNSVKDTANLAKLKLSTEKLSQSIKYAAVSGTGTKETIQLMIPQDGNIICEPAPPAASTDLNFVYILKSGEGITGCEIDDDNPSISSQCKKKINIGIPFQCENRAITAGIYTATVVKSTQTPNVRVTFELIQ